MPAEDLEVFRFILREQLAPYRAWSYAKLAAVADSKQWLNHSFLNHVEGVASDGTEYQIEFNANRLDGPDSEILVSGSLCAEPQKQRKILGLITVYEPHVSESFCVAADGTIRD